MEIRQDEFEEPGVRLVVIKNIKLRRANLTRISSINLWEVVLTLEEAHLLRRHLEKSLPRR